MKLRPRAYSPAGRFSYPPAVVMLTVGAFRGLVLLEQGYTWAAWVTLGGIFVVGGTFCWTKRNP